MMPCWPDASRTISSRHSLSRAFFVKSMGVCAFDPETLSYAGTPVQQAMCLMRGMNVSRNPLPRLSSLSTIGLRWFMSSPAYARSDGLFPRFHAAIDAQIPNGHDDPLNFDIDSFARSLDSLMVTLGSPAALITS